MPAISNASTSLSTATEAERTGTPTRSIQQQTDDQPSVVLSIDAVADPLSRNGRFGPNRRAQTSEEPTPSAGANQARVSSTSLNTDSLLAGRDGDRMDASPLLVRRQMSLRVAPSSTVGLANSSVSNRRYAESLQVRLCSTAAMSNTLKCDEREKSFNCK